MNWKLKTCTVFAPAAIVVEVSYEADPNDLFESDILWANVHHFLEEQFGIGFEPTTESKIYPSLQAGVAKFIVKRSPSAMGYVH